MANVPSPRSRVLNPDGATQQLLAMLSSQPPLDSLSPAEARAAMTAAGSLLTPDAPPVDEERSRLGGVPVRVYRPPGVQRTVALPTLLFMHGGGWTMGDMDGYGALCSKLCKAADLCVVSVDYRLAPEFPFPAALEDVLSVARALPEAAATLGADLFRLAVGGDSAGGNLAAVLCLHAAGLPRLDIRLQLLIYPVTDLRMEHPSYADCAEGFMLTAGMMRWFRTHYVGAAGDVSDWRVSPLLAEDHAASPPAHIVTCGLDPLQDEGLAYVETLQRAGVEVSTHHYPDQIHGFLSMGRVLPRAAPALAEIAHRLRSALAA